MYRAPEMLDLYQNFPINEQSDIWVKNKTVILCHCENCIEYSFRNPVRYGLISLRQTLEIYR